MKSYLSKLFLLISVQTVIANNLIIKLGEWNFKNQNQLLIEGQFNDWFFYLLGLIIDYQAEVSKGIRNDSWKQAIEQMNQMLSNKLIVDTEFIFDYDNFESEVEDDSKFCNEFFFFNLNFYSNIYHLSIKSWPLYYKYEILI